MKKVLIAVSLLIVGCQKEKIDPCFCYTITDIKSDSLVFYENNVYMSEVTIKGECTNFTKVMKYRSEVKPFNQKIGDCYKF